MGVTTFHGVRTGSSGFSRQSQRFLMYATQPSKFAALAFATAASIPMYFGWNCLM